MLVHTQEATYPIALDWRPDFSSVKKVGWGVFTRFRDGSFGVVKSFDMVGRPGGCCSRGPQGEVEWVDDIGPLREDFLDVAPPKSQAPYPRAMWTPFPAHQVAVAGSWRERVRVREAAVAIRALGLSVYDFTDPACRAVPEAAPEENPEMFDPERHDYAEYLRRLKTRGPLAATGWMQGGRSIRDAILANQLSYENCQAVVLVLPAGSDAHYDFGTAVGSGAMGYVLGAPRAGERSPVHLMARDIVPDLPRLLEYLKDPTPPRWSR